LLTGVIGTNHVRLWPVAMIFQSCERLAAKWTIEIR